MQENDQDWLSELITRIAHDTDARRWLFDTTQLTAPETLRLSKLQPVLFQIHFTVHEINSDEPSPPSVRDIVMVVKNGKIPLLAGFGSFPDPIGPLVGAIARHPGLADPQTTWYKTVLVPPNEKGGATLLSFMWKNSGALIVRAHTLTCDSFMDAPIISEFRSRCYAYPEAWRLFKIAQTYINSPTSTFISNILPCINPPSNVYWDVAGFDTKLQALCHFCHARGEHVCNCPGPMKRRATLPPAFTNWTRPLQLNRVFNRIPYHGTMFTTIWRKPPNNLPPVAIFTRSASYRIVLTNDNGWNTIRYIVSLSEKLRSVDRSISDVLDDHYYCHVCERHDVCDCIELARQNLAID